MALCSPALDAILSLPGKLDISMRPFLKDLGQESRKLSEREETLL